jgi:excisionase family DNA binding protein
VSDIVSVILKIDGRGPATMCRRTIDTSHPRRWPRPADWIQERSRFPGAGQERGQALAVRARPDASRAVASLVALEHDGPARRMAAVGSRGSRKGGHRARGPRAGGHHDRRRRRRSRDSPARLFPFVGFPALPRHGRGSGSPDGKRCLRLAPSSPDYVYKMARQGKIPSSRVGTEWRFRKDAILRWMAEKSTHARQVRATVNSRVNGEVQHRRMAGSRGRRR